MKVGAEFLVITCTTSSEMLPAIASLADGGFVISWQSYGQDGSDYGVYAQRYDANGNPMEQGITGTEAADIINLEPGQLVIVNGAGGNDTLNGSSGDDVLIGGAGGNDDLRGGAGLDMMTGDRLNGVREKLFSFHRTALSQLY